MNSTQSPTKITSSLISQANESKEFNLATIPEEEIKKNTLPEDLSETERVLQLLQKKNTIQQSYVFINAVNIFKDDPNIQTQVVPIIIKNMGSYCEEIQVAAGKAFAQLLKQNILNQEFYKDLRQVCILMLKQWSKQVLYQWSDVYTQLTTKLMKDPLQNQERLEKECAEMGLKMSELQQPISVRISSTYYLAAIITNNTIKQQSQDYINKVMPKVKQLCQDFNWEVRKEMGQQLFEISKCIGEASSIEQFFPELLELLDDEESEVKQVAIRQFTKHLTKIYSSQFCQSLDVITAFKKLISTVLLDMCPKLVRDLTLSKLPKILDRINNSSDMELVKLLQNLLKISMNNDNNKELVAKIMGVIAKVYTANDKLITQFYLPIYQQFLIDEIGGSSVKIKTNIAASMPSLIFATFLSNDTTIDNKHAIQKQILDHYYSLLKVTRKDILNELIIKADQVFDFFQQESCSIDSSLVRDFNDRIKKQILTSVEKTIRINYRYHVNYFVLIGKLFKILSPEELSNDLLPIMIKTMRSNTCSLPVKRQITENLVYCLINLPHFNLRQQIHNAVIKDLIVSKSSQERQIYLLLLEVLLPHISKPYFKQTFMEAYFYFKDDQVIHILMHFLRLAPMVRVKLDDRRQIDKLEQCVKQICNKYQSDKRAVDLIEIGEECLLKIKSAEFENEIESYHNSSKYSDLVENEMKLSSMEKNEKENSKKREIDSISRQAKSDYMKRAYINNNSSSSSSLNSVGIKDFKQQSSSTKLSADKRQSSYASGVSQTSKLGLKKQESAGSRNSKEETKIMAPAKKSSASTLVNSKFSNGGIPKKK